MNERLERNERLLVERQQPSDEGPVGRGVGPKQIQAQLGHEDVRTTLQVYGLLFEGHEDVTAAAIDAAIAAASGWNVDGTVVPLTVDRHS